MTSLFQKGKIYERWSFSLSSAVSSCTTNPPSSPFGFDNVGWKILPGRFKSLEVIRVDKRGDGIDFSYSLYTEQ